MTLARTLATIAGTLGIDINNNIVIPGNLGISTSSINAGNVLQVAGNVNITGQTVFTGSVTSNSSVTLNGAATLNGTTALNNSLTLTKAISENKGAAVASASTTNIWSNADGNLLHVTGTTTITSLGTAPQAGAKRQVIFDGALTLTYNVSTLVLPGAVNATITAGDMWEFIADTTTKIIGTPIAVAKLPAIDGSALTGIPQLATQNTFTVDQNLGRAGGVNFGIWNITTPGGVGNAGTINANAYNTSSVSKLYSQITGYMAGVTAGSENGWLIFSTYVAGVFDWRFAVGGGLFSKNATGQDKGIDTVNVKSYYVDGVQQYADTVQWTTYAATADFSVTSNTTLQNHPTLQIAVTSGVAYELMYDIYTTTPAGGGKATLAGPACSRFIGAATGTSNTGAGVATWTAFTALEAGNTSNTNANWKGMLSFTPSANGTIIVQFAQNASNVTPAVMHKASRLRIRVP
jgi:hypothetical protein